MMVVLAIHGSVKKAGFSPPQPPREVGEWPEAVLHQRLADHPTDCDRAQHEGQKERYAEELTRADIGIEQQSETESDGVLHEDGLDIEDHVAERVPEVGVAPKRAQIVETVEMMAGLRVQIPVGKGDIEAENGGKDHHSRGEEQRRQHEQRQLSAIPVLKHLTDPERDAPQEEREQRRLPVAEPDGDDAQSAANLQRRYGDEKRRAKPEDPIACRHLARKDVPVRRFNSSAAHGAMPVSAIKSAAGHAPRTLLQ